MIRSFPARPSSLYEIRRFIKEQAAEARLPTESADDLTLAVSEACANAVLHASTPEIKVAWEAYDHHVEVEIEDEGIFHSRVRMPEIEGAGGHGLHLMMALMDGFSIEEGTETHPGTRVRLVKRKAP